MPPSITSNGPQLDTYPQIVSDILNGTAVAPGFYQIYGPNINVASNSPDGECVNIFALSQMDMENFGAAIYQSFNPAQAVGVALDAIAQISGISRKAGSYTQVVVQVTVSNNLNLNGLDLVYGSTPYTVQDANGNQYYLILSASLTTGVNSLNFQSANVGFIQVPANSIMTPVSIIAGVTSVNNGTTPYNLGTNQETDANFRLRIQASNSFPSLGALNGIYAGLNNLSGMVNAQVYENMTGSPVNGIPANGIWAVVNGSTPVNIATVLYNRRTLGCPMKGSQSYGIVQADGSTATMYWDNVIFQNLYVEADVHSLNGQAINLAAIQAYLVANWTFIINQQADITTLATLIRAANPNVYAINLGVSIDGVHYFNTENPTTQQYQFVLLTANINLTTYP